MRQRRTIRIVLTNHRKRIVLQVMAYLLACEDHIASNSVVAAAIGADPRGLRRMLEPTGMFQIEMRQNREQSHNGRGTPYYRIAKDVCLRRDTPLPPLIAMIQPRHCVGIGHVIQETDAQLADCG